MAKPSFRPNFAKVAAVVPILKVADLDFNLKEIISCTRKAVSNGAQIILFPELSITGYTLGDLFQQQLILQKSWEGLTQLANKTGTINSLIVVGLPVSIESKVFNCAALIQKGRVLGLVPKTYIPGYKEFYEERWFASAHDLMAKEIIVGNEKIPVGTDLIFKDLGGSAAVAVEICEDLWSPLPPSSPAAVSGANIILNLSASNELVGKAEYRRNLVVQQSARAIAGYVYTSCGPSESTTDVVFGGHALIAEDGSLLQESERFSQSSTITYADIDLDHLATDRVRTTSFGDAAHEIRHPYRTVSIKLPTYDTKHFSRVVTTSPFMADDEKLLNERMEDIFSIQAASLMKRLTQAKISKVVLGLSGGLDSTLTLLVAVKAFKKLGKPAKNILCFTMPGFATSNRTKSNAVRLAQALGVSLETISITKGAKQQLSDIDHDGKTQDVTFENVQARYRTMILMNKSNQQHGIVLGTGDLSEIALGWSTFNGDHISNYNVNASIPKTLVRLLVTWASQQPDFQEAKNVLTDILDTPVSPELKRETKDNQISQKTEDIIGPYELHDFFLYHFVRWNSSPQKILFLAQQAFGKKYGTAILKKWLKIFIKRFFSNQWKRSVMPDGPKVGSVALSPRGDWRMPSDAEVDLWLKELN